MSPRRIWINDVTPVNAENMNSLEADVEAATKRRLEVGNVTTGPAGAVVSPPNAAGVQILDLTLPTDTDHGYLFANFTNNGRWGEKLSIFFSADGKTVVGGTSNPVYTDTHNTTPQGGTTNSLRDPSTIKIGDTWFVAYTVNNGYNKVLGLASSRDLINWTKLPDINVGATLPNLNQCWAPELLRDTNGDVYIVFSQITAQDVGTLYRVKAADYTLTAWSAPVAVAFTNPPAFAIDGVFQFHAGRWWLFYSEHGVMERATATTLTGTYTVDRTGDWAGWGTGLEGPMILKINANLYRLYLDRFTTNQGYAYSESTDLTTWTPLASVLLGSDWKPGQVLRHGSVIKLSDATAQLTVFAATIAGLPTRQHAEYTGNMTIADGAVTNIGSPSLDTGRTTDGDFITINGAGKVTFKGAGSYDIDLSLTVTNGAGVTRSFAQLRNGAGTTLYQRQAGGAEDVWLLAVQNYRAAAAEQVLLEAFLNHTTGTPASVAYRLRITRTGR